MLYEAILLFAVAFFAGFAFHFASRGAPLEGWLRFAHQLLLLAVFAAYLLWCWLRGGQTLAMKAWRIRLVGVKVFLGIMLGIFFHMMNSLFAHIGLLQNWPPFAAAALPSAGFLLAAVMMMWLVERR